MHPTNQNSKSNTLAISIVAVVLVLAAIIFFYKSGSKPSSAGNVTTTELASIGSNELALLSKIQTLRIDIDFFKRATFRSLVDHSVPITPENVGRPNPFAPIPGIPNPYAKVLK